MRATDFRATLRILTENKVDFIVVGGVAAVLEGVPVNTFDLDVIHLRDPKNVSRLLSALDALGARYRTQPERHLKPQASHLMSAGHQLLTTRFGPLDLLGSIGRSHTYEDLLPDSIEVNAGVRIRVLKLERQIAIKEETAGEKDLAVLPVLRRTLEEKKRGKI
jgi:predicted nucleotidyltransferase